MNKNAPLRQETEMQKIKGEQQRFRWLAKKNEEFCKEYPILRQLERKLLSLGGMQVAIQPDEDAESILGLGRTFPARTAVQMEGKMSRCHGNVACIWDADRKRLKIVTGWALSEDGIWRQHSWAWDTAKRCVIETTLPRTMYFGFVLPEREAEKFYLAEFW